MPSPVLLFVMFFFFLILSLNRNRLCQGTVHLWGRKQVTLLYNVNPFKHYFWFYEVMLCWLLKACIAFGVGRGFPTMTSCQRCLICLPPVNCDAKYVSARMKVLFIWGKKRKMWIFSWCTSRSTFIQKVPATDLFEKLSFLLQWNIWKLILKWDDFFEQKIFKEKSNLGCISVNEDPTEFIDFCVSSCKYQQSGRLFSWNFIYFHQDIWYFHQDICPVK